MKRWFEWVNWLRGPPWLLRVIFIISLNVNAGNIGTHLHDFEFASVDVCVYESNCVLPINKLSRSVRFPKVAGGCLIVSFLRGCGCHKHCCSDGRWSRAEQSRSALIFASCLAAQISPLLFAIYTCCCFVRETGLYVACVVSKKKDIHFMTAHNYLGIKIARPTPQRYLLSSGNQNAKCTNKAKQKAKNEQSENENAKENNAHKLLPFCRCFYCCWQSQRPTHSTIWLRGYWRNVVGKIDCLRHVGADTPFRSIFSHLCATPAVITFCSRSQSPLRWTQTHFLGNIGCWCLKPLIVFCSFY